MSDSSQASLRALSVNYRQIRGIIYWDLKDYREFAAASPALDVRIDLRTV